MYFEVEQLRANRLENELRFEECGPRTRLDSFAYFLERAEAFVIREYFHADVAQIGRFCATRGFTVKCCVTRLYVRALGYFRAIDGDEVVLGNQRDGGGASAGSDWGSGEVRSLAMTSPTFKKLRICAMRDR
jgi:hypothetical protein